MFKEQNPPISREKSGLPKGRTRMQSLGHGFGVLSPVSAAARIEEKNNEFKEKVALFDKNVTDENLEAALEIAQDNDDRFSHKQREEAKSLLAKGADRRARIEFLVRANVGLKKSEEAPKPKSDKEEYREELQFMHKEHKQDIDDALFKRGLDTGGTPAERIERLVNYDYPIFKDVTPKNEDTEAKGSSEKGDVPKKEKVAEYQKLQKAKEKITSTPLPEKNEPSVKKSVYRNEEHPIISNYRFRDIPHNEIKEFARKLATRDGNVLSTKEGSAFYAKYRGLIEPLITSEIKNVAQENKEIPSFEEQMAAVVEKIKKGRPLSEEEDSFKKDNISELREALKIQIESAATSTAVVAGATKTFPVELKRVATAEEIGDLARKFLRGENLNKEDIDLYRNEKTKVDELLGRLEKKEKKAPTPENIGDLARKFLRGENLSKEDIQLYRNEKPRVDDLLNRLEKTEKPDKKAPAPEQIVQTDKATPEQIGDYVRGYIKGERGSSDADREFHSNNKDHVEMLLRNLTKKENKEPVQTVENVIPVTIKKEVKKEAVVEAKTEEPPRVFTEEDKKKHKELAERLYFEEDGAVMTPEEKAFYEDPMNKSAIHRERTRLARKEEKFGNTIHDIEEKEALEKERLFNIVKENVKDPRVLSALEKMNLDLRYIYKCGPKFFDMDGDKQLYILEKIRQKVSQDAMFEAKARVEKNLARKPKSIKDRLRKIWQGFTKEFEETKARREVIDEVKTTGMEDYSLDIEAYVNHVDKLDTPIRYDENGRLRIEYINPENSVWLDKYMNRFEKGTKEADYIQKFNEAATKLSEIPYEWTQSGSTILQKRQYKKALELYELRKTIVMGGVTEKAEKGITPGDKEGLRQLEGQMLAWANTLDSKVEMNRLLTTFPELQKEEDKGFWKSLNPDNWNPADTKRLWGLGVAGAAVGVLGRQLSRTTGSLGVSMVFGGALGGLLAWRQKHLEYSDKERNKRYGAETKDAGVKRYLDAYLTARRIEKLTEAVTQELDEVKRAKMIETLKNRLSVTDERLGVGRVNFGNKDQSSANKLHLIQAMAEARTQLFTLGAYNDSAESEVLFERFNKFQKDIEARKFKKKDIRKAIKWGAIKGAGGALAGWLIADLYAERGSSQSVENRFKEIIFEGGEGKWNDVPEEMQPYNRGLQSPESIPVESAAPVIQETITEIEPTPAPVEETVESAPSMDDSPEDLDLQLEDQADDEALADNSLITPEAATPTSYELSADIKDNLKMSPDGKILDLKDPLNFESAKKFSQNSGNFLSDMTNNNMPDNFQNRSWGMQALSRVAPDAEKFLAWQEVLEQLPENSEDAEMIRGKMVDLGEGIREDLAEYAKNKSGVETMGNFFKPYEEWIGTTTIVSPDNNLTASLEGVGTPSAEIPEVSSGESAVTEGAPIAQEEATTSSSETQSVRLNEDVTKYYNGDNPGLDFGVENENIKGKLEFERDADGDIINIKEINENGVKFETKVGKEFRNSLPMFISDEDLGKFGLLKGEAVNEYERYLDLYQALETSGLPANSEEALAIKAEMAHIDEEFTKRTQISIKDRLEAIENGDGIESLNPSEATVEGFKVNIDHEIPTDSKVFTGAVEQFGAPEKVSGNMAIFKDGKVGFYWDSQNLSVAQDQVSIYAEKNGFLGKAIYTQEKMLGNTYRVFCVFEK